MNNKYELLCYRLTAYSVPKDVFEECTKKDINNLNHKDYQKVGEAFFKTKEEAISYIPQLSHSAYSYILIKPIFNAPHSFIFNSKEIRDETICFKKEVGLDGKSLIIKEYDIYKNPVLKFIVNGICIPSVPVPSPEEVIIPNQIIRIINSKVITISKIDSNNVKIDMLKVDMFDKNELFSFSASLDENKNVTFSTDDIPFGYEEKYIKGPWSTEKGEKINKKINIHTWGNDISPEQEKAEIVNAIQTLYDENYKIIRRYY